jgi:hypothetical protein
MLGCYTYGSLILGEVSWGVTFIPNSGGVGGGIANVNILSIMTPIGGSISGGEALFKRLSLVSGLGGGLGGGQCTLLSLMSITSVVTLLIRGPEVKFSLLIDQEETV